MFTLVPGRYVTSTVYYQYPNLSEGADRVGGQMRGDKECPFSGVTNSGRVRRKGPEGDARRVARTVPLNHRGRNDSCVSVFRLQGFLKASVAGDVQSSECRPGRPDRPNEPYGFRRRKAILNHAHALVSACP